jgi:tRNA(adenine34) deaminase
MGHLLLRDKCPIFLSLIENKVDIQTDILDHYFMEEALRLARQAYDEGEIPVGAVVVIGERIIGKGYNQTERLNDVTAHAEMIAITAASDHLGSKYLQDCTLYVTLEPCVMCAGALYWTQMKRVVLGATDEKRGFSKLGKGILHPKTKLSSGILSAESQELLVKFFRQLRT